MGLSGLICDTCFLFNKNILSQIFPFTIGLKCEEIRVLYLNLLFLFSGHAHITDFNIATQLSDTDLATSMSGTKPYMGPEIFDCAADECVGYRFLNLHQTNILFMLFNFFFFFE